MFIRAVLGCVLVFGLAGEAQATTLTEASIDWPGVYLGIPPGWQVEQYASHATSTGNAGGGDGRYDPTDTFNTFTAGFGLTRDAGEVSILTTFLLSGAGEGRVSVTVPFNLLIQRSEVTEDHGETAFASVSGEGFGYEQVVLGWGTRDLRNGEDADAFSIRHEAVFGLLQTFVNPSRTFVSFETHARSFTSVPEPSTWLLMGLGLVGLVFWKRQRG